MEKITERSVVVSFLNAYLSIFRGFILLLFAGYWVPFSWAGFDVLENWGFEQGGGLRQGNFVGEDANLVLVDMAWDAERRRVAVAGALGDNWAARVYTMEVDGPVLLASWDGHSSIHHATVSALSWIPGSGRLACGVEHLVGDKMAVQIFTLDPDNNMSIDFIDLPGWDSLIDLQGDPDPETQGNLLALGTVSEGSKGQGQCLSVNPVSKVLSNQLGTEKIEKPTGMTVLNGQIWIAGQAGKKGFVEAFQKDKGKKIGVRTLHDSYISGIEASGDNVYLTGRLYDRKARGELENFFLVSMRWNGKRSIEEVWSVLTKDVENGREVGTNLLAMPDGGVLVGGNFGKSWMLGQSEPAGQLALLSPTNYSGEGFDSFLARYDENGSLLWAQNSGLSGNDFLVGLVHSGENNATLLGNRKVDGGFGPYLSQVQLGGSPSKNAPLVDPGVEELAKVSVISWDPPETLRFGEPIDGNHLSARAMGKANFQYEINGSIVASGDIPLFEPGEVDIIARLFREQSETNSTSATFLGLKGRPYLKLGFQQDQTQIQLTPSLFGLHPAHSEDFVKMKSLIEGIALVMIKEEGNVIIEQSMIEVDPQFTGTVEIIGTFQGDSHYEATTRRMFLELRDGQLFSAGDQGIVTLQVKDLDGWQGNVIVSKGAEVQISATQGFGTNRKFNRWVEFSESSQKLRTARVQSPFSIRTSLLADEDMTLFAHYNFTFVGTAINGYLGGSKVFLDFNLNGLFDEDEPFGFSTENGGFELEVSEESIQTHDKNGNGTIDPTEGMLVVLGGVDHSSNLPLSISYRAPASYSVITAVSTLVAELVEAGNSLEDAEADVTQFLSMPDDIQFSSFEPIQEVFVHEEKAQRFILRSTQLANLLNEGSRFIQMKTGGQVNRVRGAELIVTALKDKLLEQSGRRSNAISQTLDLNDPILLLGVIQSAESEAVHEIDPLQEVQLLRDSSLREQLANSQPEIAEIGNVQILNQMVEQVASANTMLGALTNNPDVDPTAFKALASASQSILNELGTQASNTIFEDEVDLLVKVTGSGATVAQNIINLTTVVEPLPSNDEIQKNFNLSALEEFSSTAGINVFAPTLTASEILSPQGLNDNLVLGKFTAIDPEGGIVSYSIVGQNPDFDADGQSIFSIDPNSGQIQIQDFDDLRLMNRDVLEPIIRVTDVKGLFREEEMRVNLADWTYLAGRLQLVDLALKVPENLPIGTVIHKFDDQDSVGDSIEYLLISGEGAGDNALFDLDGAGNLRTAVVFDFETSSLQLGVRVQAKDSRYNTVEKTFTLQVTDVVVPNVQTGQAQVLADGTLRMNATMTSFGSVGNELKVGFLVARSPLVDLHDSSVSKISAEGSDPTSFYTRVETAGRGGEYYFIAYAENLEGINYGLEKVFTLPKISTGKDWRDGMQVENFTHWWESDWLGLFYTELYPWVYHQKLGWVFVNVDSLQGAWLYRERLGWLWTMPNVFPSLHMSERKEWTYLDTTRERTTMYDYINQAWFEPDTPISILGMASPSNGGEIKGLGSYYRWDPVILEAKPSANFNFGGWSGDLIGVKKTHTFEAIRSLEIEASFIPLPSAGTSGKEVVNGVAKALDKMDLTEPEKKKSMAELLIFGESKTSGLSIGGSE